MKNRNNKKLSKQRTETVIKKRRERDRGREEHLSDRMRQALIFKALKEI